MSHRLAAFVLPTVLLLAGPLRAQAPKEGDLLDEAKRRQNVAAQKAEADFRAAVVELHRLALKDPAKAAERFGQLAVALEDDTVLDGHKRTAWQRMAKDRVRVLQAEAADKARSETEQADKGVKVDERRSAAEQKARDDERTRAALDAARRFQNDGKSADAARAANDAAKRSPDNPAANAASRITNGKQALDDLRALRREKNDRFELAMRETERSSILPKGDIEYPSPEKWREITKRRAKSNVTAAEQAILKALETPISVNFKGSTFEGAVDYLQTVTGQTILVDKGTLDQAGITYDTPVNTQARQITLRTLLRKMLGQFNLTYVVKDQTIQVVTPERAKEMMAVRTYYLGDMAAGVDFRFGPAVAYAQMQDAVNQLIGTIVGTVEPDSWEVNRNGGRGTIHFDARSLTLVVKQSAEIHYMLGGFGK